MTMTPVVPPQGSESRRPPGSRKIAAGSLLASALLLLALQPFTSLSTRAYEAAAGDGTPGTYTVTGVNDTRGGAHGMTGTFTSTDHRVVIKGMTYKADPPVSPGATVPVIKPAWNWLGISSDQVLDPGPNSAGLPMMAFVGALDLVSLTWLSWSAWFLIRTRRPSPPASTR